MQGCDLTPLQGAPLTHHAACLRPRRGGRRAQPPRPLTSPLPQPPVPGSQVPRCPTGRPAGLPGLRNGSRPACSRPCGILSPNLKLTDGWLLGGPHVWSSSREKPQVQPSKSINKLISKYCCLPSRTGTPGRTDFKSTPDGHRACREPGHLSGWKFQSPPPWPPGLEARLGAAAGPERSRTEAATEESPVAARVHLHPRLLPWVRCFPPRGRLGHSWRQLGSGSHGR